MQSSKAQRSKSRTHHRHEGFAAFTSCWRPLYSWDGASHPGVCETRIRPQRQLPSRRPIEDPAAKSPSPTIPRRPAPVAPDAPVPVEFGTTPVFAPTKQRIACPSHQFISFPFPHPQIRPRQTVPPLAEQRPHSIFNSPQWGLASTGEKR